MKLIKKIDLEFFHQWLKYVKKKTLKHIQKTVRNIKIQNELSDDCEICMHAQKTKMQNHEAVKSVNKLMKRLYIDFWNSYQHDSVNDS